MIKPNVVSSFQIHIGIVLVRRSSQIEFVEDLFRGLVYVSTMNEPCFRNGVGHMHIGLIYLKEIRGTVCDIKHKIENVFLCVSAQKTSCRERA